METKPEVVDVVKVSTVHDLWSVMFNGRVPGDSKKYHGRAAAETAARWFEGKDGFVVRIT